MSENGLKELNLAIWNNDEVSRVTGYQLTDIKDCLFDLAEFISSNLSPNRLAGFDIEAIKKEEDFCQLPNNLEL